MAHLPGPTAAADVAAMEDEAAAWVDALDVDDSDLRLDPPSPRLPRPCTTAAPHPSKPPPRSSHHHRIPGPASAVQDAMRLRCGAASPVLGRVANAQAADADFLLHPWLCALRFLGKGDAWENPGIRAIKGDRELHRAPLVVGVVMSCKPNGLGDLVLTLKDPSDTIGASVHKKVLLEGNIAQDISVGCVILVSKVAVFRPSRTACYLNVTKGKVVKVLRKDCHAPSEQVISSSTTESQLPATRCQETGRVAHLGDNHMERRAEIEISEGAASIFSKMTSRTQDSLVAKVHSENSDASNVVHNRTLGLDRGTIHSVENKTNLNPSSKNAPNYRNSQQSLKTFSSIYQANRQQGQEGSSPIYGRSGSEGSTNNIMMRLLGRERMMPGSKDMTVADVSCDHYGRPDSSDSTSTLDTYARCSSGNNQEILTGSTDGQPQQNCIIPSTILQPSVGGSLVMSGGRYCTQAGANENLRRPYDNEQMLHSSKKLKSNAVLPDGTGATDDSSMDNENKHCLESNMNIEMELDDTAGQSNGEHASIRKPNEHQRRNNAGSVEPTKEGTTTITKKAVSVASVAGWTEEQLAELFADY